MLKIRLQGTTKDIKWFFKILSRDKRFMLYDPSEIFDIKESRKFKRAYAQIFRNEADCIAYKNAIAARKKNDNCTRYYDTGVVFGSPVAEGTKR